MENFQELSLNQEHLRIVLLTMIEILYVEDIQHNEILKDDGDISLLTDKDKIIEEIYHTNKSVNKKNLMDEEESYNDNHLSSRFKDIASDQFMEDKWNFLLKKDHENDWNSFGIIDDIKENLKYEYDNFPISN